MNQRLDLVSIAFHRPQLISEQIRLLQKYVEDPFELTVLDNSSNDDVAGEIRRLCEDGGGGYELLATARRMHHEALNYAAERFRERGSDFYGFFDHDVMPTRATKILSLIEKDGFLGIGQRAPATGKLYPWPGWFFLSREWLGDRRLDFGGAGGGDTGSALQDLFREDEWEKFYRVGHGYRAVRHPDDVGLQSWGYECFSTQEGEPDWIHLTNGSRWMEVPDIEGRERIIFEMLAEL